MLRILQQCMYYPPEVGGLETHVAGLSEGLVRHGQQVVMITSRSQPGLKRKETASGVEVRRVWMPSRSPLGWMAHVTATLPLHLRLGRDCDVFHAHTFACGPAAMSTRMFFPRPYVLTLHTSHFLMRADKPVWRAFFRRIIAAADHLLATSEEIRDVARSIYPHPRAEVMVNAVDTERFSPAAQPHSTSRRRLIVPRRLFHKNGVEHFIRAMPLISGELDVEARIVGDGPEREKLQALAKQLGIDDRIEFMGARSNAEMPELLGWADLAVIPSLIEATSIAALEAMACGLPVAASAVGGLPEIVDEQVGALFEPANPRALAAAVLELLRQPDLTGLGAEGRRRVVANWSIGRMVERHLAIYSELIDEAKTRSR